MITKFGPSEHDISGHGSSRLAARPPPSSPSASLLVPTLIYLITQVPQDECRGFNTTKSSSAVDSRRFCSRRHRSMCRGTSREPHFDTSFIEVSAWHRLRSQIYQMSPKHACSCKVSWRRMEGSRCTKMYSTYWQRLGRTRAYEECKEVLGLRYVLVLISVCRSPN